VADHVDVERDEVASLSGIGDKLHAFQLKDSLLKFTREAWEILEPEHDFVENWHVEVLCELLEQIERGQVKRTIINVPPGTMKSLLVSVIFPCWLWAKNPRLRILTAAYSDKRALDANLKARTLMKSPWFQKYFPLEFLEGQDAKGRFDTTKGGWRIATSVGGEGTGLHPDLIIIDDASTATDAQSETARKTVTDWYSGTVSSRGVSRGVKVIVIGQRLHEEDLPGYLLKKDRAGWELVRWPMRFEKCECPPDAHDQERCSVHKADPQWQPDKRDRRSESGELLFPQLFDEIKVRQLELDLGPLDAAGQLQQRPSPEGGGLFKREWFKYAETKPKLMRVARGWDTAASENKGDWTVGCKIGEEFEWNIVNNRRKLQSTGRFFVLDVIRVQLGPDGVDKLMLNTATADGRSCAQREEKEGGSSGKAVIDARTKRLRGFNYGGVQTSGSKITRAKPFRSQCEGGNVYLLRAEEWNEKYITELCAFPAAKHDDQVDASSCAFNSVLLEEPPRVLKSASW
jgi:predicted phage terminase large subunit-like protein